MGSEGWHDHVCSKGKDNPSMTDPSGHRGVELESSSSSAQVNANNLGHCDQSGTSVDDVGFHQWKSHARVKLAHKTKSDFMFKAGTRIQV